MFTYVFFDIDNTLVSHRGQPHIPPATTEALRLLREGGHVPAIATGRAGFLTMNVAQASGITHLVCAGGSEIFAGGDKIHTAYLAEEVVEAFREVAAGFPDLTAAVDEEFLYADAAFDPFRAYFNGQAGYDCFRPMSELRRATMCYIMMPHSMLDMSHGLFFTPCSGTRLELMRGFTEARAESSTKWGGIVRMIETLGGNVADVVAFGDGPNDADMLRRAGVGVAVGRCADDARDAADFVCGDIDDGGILEACRDLGLI